MKKGIDSRLSKKKTAEEYIQILKDEGSTRLSSEILIHLALLEYKGDFRKDDEMRTVLFCYLKKNKKYYISGKMKKNEIHSRIEQYYHEDQKGNYDYFYGGIPKKELWRLFVDLNKQRKPKEKGWIGYETREKGCIQAMYNAFQFIQSTREEPLTPAYIKKIHQHAADKCPPLIENIFEGLGWGMTINKVESPILPGQYRGAFRGTITLGKSKVTPLGIFKLIKSSDEVTYTRNKRYFLIFPKYLENDSQYDHAIEQSITCYEQEIQNKSPIDTLKAIIKLVHSIEGIHPFRDGNLRTCVLLLNRELVRHGFTPSLLDDPNRFDGFTKTEMLYEVLRGMENFSVLKSNGSFPDCETTANILRKECYPHPILDVS